MQTFARISCAAVESCEKIPVRDKRDLNTVTETERNRREYLVTNDADGPFNDSLVPVSLVWPTSL